MKLLNEITALRQVGPFRLELVYNDGATFTVDFLTYAQDGGVFGRLADPEYFGQVQIGEGHGYIEWPDGLDFCADALRMDAEAIQGLQPRAS